MTELFRYAVVRPVERRRAPRLRLQHTTGHDAMLQASLQNAGEKQDWNSLEALAIRYLQQHGALVLQSAWLPATQTFYAQLLKTPPSELSPQQWPVRTWPEAAVRCADILAGRAGQQARREVERLGRDLSDLFLSLLIARSGGPDRLDTLIRQYLLWDIADLLHATPALPELAAAMRSISLILAPPASIKSASDVTQLLNQTLLVPGGMFSVFEKPVHSIGFAQLHLVKQHIRRYDLGEIARIENVMKGELRSHSTKHVLTTSQTTLTQTETTTTTENDLTSRDQVNIKNELETLLKSDTKLDAGVQLTFGQPGGYEFKSDLKVAHDDSSSQTTKFASDIAKDVTTRAVQTVSQRVLQSQETLVVETFEENESTTFDNVRGDDHISGVYRWVEKVYLAQTFQYGKRLLFDVMVPEPAASLVAASSVQPANRTRLQPPDPLGTTKQNPDGTDVVGPDGVKVLDSPLEPLALSESPSSPNYYGAWVAKFGVNGVEPPPAESLTVSKPILFAYKDDDIKQSSDTLRIEPGYGAYRATIALDCLRNDNPDGGISNVYVDVSIGTKTLRFPWPDSGDRFAQMTGSFFLDPQFPPYPSGGPVLPDHFVPRTVEVGTIGYTVYGPNINQMSVNIELECRRLPVLTARWQLQTFEKIAQSWQKLVTDYRESLKEEEFQRSVTGPLGTADPLRNREIERSEIKRACIAILDNDNATVRGLPPQVAVTVFTPDGGATAMGGLPEPILAFAGNTVGTPSQELGARVRWFEEAFEWEHIGYVFYPYFWGRRETWIERLNRFIDDALFLQFLQAGYARVLVPVRRGFEEAMQFYLMTGRPWLGGELPHVGDETQNPLYLDLSEELKQQSGAPGDELPSDDPWEIRLPTTLIKLEKEDAVAQASDLLPEWHRAAGLPSDEAGGNWTWVEGTPPP